MRCRTAQKVLLNKEIIELIALSDGLRFLALVICSTGVGNLKNPETGELNKKLKQ